MFRLGTRGGHDPRQRSAICFPTNSISRRGFRRGITTLARLLLLPISPRLAAAGTATPEFAPLSAFNDHIVPGKGVAELAEFEIREDDRTLQPVMGRVAAGLPNASRQLAGKNAMTGSNDTDERLPEQARSGALRGSAAEHSIAILAERPAPYPASSPADRDPLHEARLAHDFHLRVAPLCLRNWRVQAAENLIPGNILNLESSPPFEMRRSVLVTGVLPSQ